VYPIAAKQNVALSGGAVVKRQSYGISRFFDFGCLLAEFELDVWMPLCSPENTSERVASRDT
jgi:hypothetical protein